MFSFVFFRYHYHYLIYLEGILQYAKNDGTNLCKLAATTLTFVFLILVSFEFALNFAVLFHSFTFNLSLNFHIFIFFFSLYDHACVHVADSFHYFTS